MKATSNKALAMNELFLRICAKVSIAIGTTLNLV
jgi:hypothetical protein